MVIFFTCPVGQPGEQRMSKRSRHPGFNPYYVITAIREPNFEIDD
jgi:hypothetical protein